MKRWLENFRSYSMAVETELLIEGRKDDAKIKYPGLAKKREELDGESLLDVLIDKDPSGNQKYLMGAARLLQRSIENAEQENGYYPFYGKQWPEDAADNLYSPWGVANNIANELSKYHSLQPYIRDHDKKFKDINNVATYSQLQLVVTGAQNTKTAIAQAKEEKKRESAAAKAGSTLIDDNDHQVVIRPLTPEASCYYGKSTKWCISATRSQNYFDQYTSDGKSFYFLLAKRKDVDDAYKKIAMVVDRDGSPDEYYDSEDDTMTHSLFRDVLRQIMVGPKTSGEMTSLEENESYDKDIILDELEKWKGINGFDFDRNEHEDHDGLRDLISMFSDFVVEEYMSGLHAMASEDTLANPAGTPEEDYEEKLDEYQKSWNYLHVDLSFPSETGVDNVYWESNMYLDLESIVIEAEGFEFTPAAMAGEMEEELYTSVDDALNNVNIWPEEVEQDKWGSNPGFEFRIRVQNGGGSLDDFEQFLEDVSREDQTVREDFFGYLIDHLEDTGVIIHPEREEAKKEAERQKTRDAEYWPDPEEKKKQIDLPLHEHRIRLKIVKSR